LIQLWKPVKTDAAYLPYLKNKKRQVSENQTQQFKMKKHFSLLSLTLLLSCPIFAQGIFSAVQENDVIAIKYLLNRGVNIDSKDSKGETPLMTAVTEKQKTAVAYLIERDADINLQDKTGNTALIEASLNNFNEATDLLITHAAELDIQNKKGVTALIAAVTAGNTVAVKALITKGADVTLKDSNHKTAIDYANDMKDTEIRALLNGPVVMTAVPTR